MSPHKDIKFPPLTPSQKQRLTYDRTLQNDPAQTTEEGPEGQNPVSAQPAAIKMCWKGSSYIYAGLGRKPQLLIHMESYVNKELHTISSHEPKFQELKLQVYRDVFGCFIREFKTYQPLLSAIKKEYETTLAHQQEQIRELEPMRSHLRLVSEECDRKIQARCAEEHAEIEALKREKQQLQRDIEAMREREKAKQAVVDRLQSELSSQYLQYREERDARKLLIWQLSDLTRGPGKEERSADPCTEEKDQVELQLALKVCRADLTKAQEELNRMKAEYWDVVPRRNWDTLERTHKQTILQLKTLLGDFDKLKSEYDTLLELHKGDSMQNEAHDHITVQMDDTVSKGQNQIQSSHLKVPLDSDAPESSTLREFRPALRTVFPLKSVQEKDELVASAQCEPDSSKDAISSQRPHCPLAESSVAALSAALDKSEENAVSSQLPASK
ncbi:translin-associated factor X-interacting protein 1 isoform X2 [Sparus aurata]|uniref:translin-associated factor X-interacting protein 1 isoform X2 n=1 Tax=Sparus aurata TaxID=8175 RepID=UPI0011C16F90|nr:translin-associated factor X-interacting protein 1 isoform X2 [Sparus aurata]